MSNVINSLAGMFRHRINGITLGEVELPSGTGTFAAGTLCVMQMVNVAIWGADRFKEEGNPSDSPDTQDADPIPSYIREFAISMNDSLQEGARQRLREYVIRIADCRVDDEHDDARLKVHAALSSRGWSWEVPKTNPKLAFQAFDAILAGDLKLLPTSFS